MNGKSLSKHMNSLDQAAGELGVTPLSEFYSIDPEQAAEFWADEGIEPGDIKLSPLEQFSARDGLATVRALLAHKAVHKSDVVEDLQDCERILIVAAEHGVGWHFEIDI